MRALLLALPALPALACIPSQRASYRNPTDTHRGAIAAAGVRRIELEAGVGEVHVTSDGGDSVAYVVALRSQDERRLRETCIPRSRVEAPVAGGIVRLRLEQPGREHCGEVWTVRVPSGVSAQVTGSVTKVTLDGSYADVRVRLGGPGSLRGTLTAPTIDVELGQGRIDLEAMRSSYGSIELRADIGDVELTLNGMRIPPQRRSGPGESLILTGQGPGVVHLRSKLGNVRLRVGR